MEIQLQYPMLAQPKVAATSGERPGDPITFATRSKTLRSANSGRCSARDADSRTSPVGQNRLDTGDRQPKLRASNCMRKLFACAYVYSTATRGAPNLPCACARGVCDASPQGTPLDGARSQGIAAVNPGSSRTACNIASPSLARHKVIARATGHILARRVANPSHVDSVSAATLCLAARAETLILKILIHRWAPS